MPMRSVCMPSLSSAQRSGGVMLSSSSARYSRMRGLIARLELVDDLVQRRHAVQDRPSRVARPDMRDRLGHLAHIVVGHRQQHRVHALRNQVADQRALEQLEGERARDHAHREAPVRVRRAAQVIGQDRRLGAGGVCVVEPVEKGGEGLHARNVIRNRPWKKPGPSLFRSYSRISTAPSRTERAWTAAPR